MRRSLLGVAAALVCVVLLLQGEVAGREPGRVAKERYKKLLGKALRDFITRFKPEAKGRLKFRANLFLAHEVCIKTVPLEVLKRQVDALAEAGASGVDINMGLSPWLNGDRKVAEKYDALIKHIRDRGLELAINPAYSVVSCKIADWDDWCARARKVWREIARRYKPDIFVVVHEPTTQNARMKLKASPEQWAAFAKAAAAAVKKVSPGTDCGAGVLHNEYPYFKEFVRIGALRYISFDVYNMRGLKSVNKMIEEAKEAGKAFYIEETWRPPCYAPGPGDTLDRVMAKDVGLAEFAELDRLWLEFVVIYASAWRMDAVTPFWTQTFFKYVKTGGDALGRDYNLAVIEAVLDGRRTETYRRFAELVERYGKGFKRKEIRFAPIRVKSARILGDGGRVDWSAAGDLIAFDRKGADGFYDVYIMKPDGSDLRCLTRGVEGLPQRHIGNPAWHPSGKYIVFQAEEEKHYGMDDRWSSNPGVGCHNNLWLLRLSDGKCFRLTDLEVKTSSGDGRVVRAVLNPRFSPDGGRLVWTERYAVGGRWGRWRIMCADFLDGDEPKLDKAKALFTPGADMGAYCTAMDFTPDGKKLLIAGNLSGKNHHEFGMDQYILDPETGRLTDLTNSPRLWEEGSSFALGGGWVVYSCNEGSPLNFKDEHWYWQKRSSEYWMVRTDGSWRARLTHFNDKGYPEYMGRPTIVCDHSWGPDGRRLVAVIGLDHGAAEKADFRLKIALVEFEEQPVKSMKVFMEDVGRLDWCDASGLMVFDKRGADDYFDVFVARPDGRVIRSLTDGVKGVPQRHNGCPAWHPSGKYVLFQSEMERHFGGSEHSRPGAGLWCNLWVADVAGGRFWKLTDYPPGPAGRGALHPHFSRDGGKIVWAERQGNLEGKDRDWGRWAIKVADFVVDDEKGPRIENVRSFTPGRRPCFFETHGFSPDGTKVIFSANVKKGQHVTGIDICTLDLKTGRFSNLTESFADWDEHAHYSPDGKRICWMSSTGYKVTPDARKWRTVKTDLRTDLWMMAADGKNKRRLTFFNEKGHPEYMEHAVVADNTWLPDGRTVAALVLDVRTFTSRMHLIKLWK